jgi:hypothetical protein
LSRLRRLHLSDRFFFVTARLLKWRSELRDANFHFLVLPFRRARVLHPFLFDRLGVPSPSLARHLRSGVSAHHLRGDEIQSDSVD